MLMFYKCSFTAPKYPKYNHWIASFAFPAGLEMSYPYFSAITFNWLSAFICSDISSLSLITFSVKSSTLNIYNSSFFSSINAYKQYSANLL